MSATAFAGFLRLVPELRVAKPLRAGGSRCFIAACGFEDRSEGWLASQETSPLLSRAYLFRYSPAKGRNRIKEMEAHVARLGVGKPVEIRYAVERPQTLEASLSEILSLEGCNEVVVDISAMTKLLILITLDALRGFAGLVRIVYAEAREYGPSVKEFDPVRRQMAKSARLPSIGADQVIRLRAFSSVRMQGQPVTLIGFTSFNEQLLRHQLAVLAPHRLILVNGRPPRAENRWREEATLEIHEALRAEYLRDNPLLPDGSLARTASTLDHKDVLPLLEAAYLEFGARERIVCAITGSKMQTVGLFVFRELHPDVQLEYPTPDSYFVKDFTHGVLAVHEIEIPSFRDFVRLLSRYRMESSQGVSLVDE